MNRGVRELLKNQADVTSFIELSDDDVMPIVKTLLNQKGGFDAYRVLSHIKGHAKVDEAIGYLVSTNQF